jgi:uncharacterized protein (DUF342 family)
VDFRQRAAHLSVADGQLLARLLPPQDGEPGMDVFGRPIAVARARAYRVRTGPNVRFVESEASFYATASGRIRWTAETLSVDPLIEIPGSVGLLSGNVVHPGALVVGKDIEPGSAVKAAGDVEVKGAVEAADVECGGSLVVFGGLVGGEGRRVRAGGGVQARFVRDAEVEAGGDIVVEKEVVQSILKTRGALLMPRGRVVGGEVTALRSIEVRDAGSPAGIHTTLVAGEDFSRSEEVAALRRQIFCLEESVARIRHALDEAAARVDKMSSGQLHALMALEIKAQEADEELTDLRSRLRSCGGEAGKSRPRIVIHGILYPETVLRIGGERLNATDAVRGPLTALVSGGNLILAPSEVVA